MKNKKYYSRTKDGKFLKSEKKEVKKLSLI